MNWRFGLTLVLLTGGCVTERRAPEPRVIAVGSAPTVPPPSAPLAPERVADYALGNCELVATASHVYWLELRGRARPPADAGAPGRASTPVLSRTTLTGAALQCDDAGGALIRASRKAHERVTVATLDYRPFGLTMHDGIFYWTGAPCTGRGRSMHDPEWFWSYDGTAVPHGPRDRHFLGAMASEHGIFTSDRFGKGGAYRFDAAHPEGEQILDDQDSPWLIAADANTLAWTDRSWVFTRTDLVRHVTSRAAPLLAMPMDGAAFAGGWLVRTTEAIVLLTADGLEEARFPIASYGDRGSGAFVAGRHYYWADGDDTLSRLDVTTRKVIKVRAPEAQQACGVAVHGDTIFWADRKREAVFAWRTGVFDEAPP